ncbi:O-antigen ligase family protein [Candidatus Curtissbacteria bacterium]|nr:O-antigen ligase family protein [Candidatus Curtissbacteria bacterium]
MELVKYLLIACLGSTVIGQLIRLEFFPTAALTLTDVIVLATDVVFVILALTLKKSLNLKTKLFVPAIVFTLFALATNVLAILNLPQAQVFASSLFLFRFLSLVFIAFVVSATVSRQKITNWVNLMLTFGLVFAVVGILQLIFFPDLSAYTVYGWDPHQKRVFSTFLDPNFTGFANVIFFNVAIACFLFAKRPYKKLDYYYLIVAIFSFISLILTFSRSSYLAFMAAIAVIGLVKSPKLFLIAAFAFLSLFLLVPQMQARIVGAFRFDDTSQARVESWQNGLAVFEKNPVFGTGFNTFRYVQARDNLFTNESPLGGHSGSGVDSSLLLVAATTGIVGEIIFLTLFLFVFLSVKKKATKNPIKLAACATIVSIFVHSQFVNSLFFPQIMLLFWFLIGLTLANDS